MGTRSVTRFIEVYENYPSEEGNGENHLVSIYQQFDGYLTGVGQEIVDFIESGEMVNGLGLKEEGVFNGPGCFAAQFIKAYKTRAGGLYITSHDDSQEYNYDVLFVYDKLKYTGVPEVFIRYEDKRYTSEEFKKVINKEAEEWAQ